MSEYLLIFLGVTLFLSFLFSGSETAFLTSDNLFIEFRAKQGDKTYHRIRFYMQNPEWFLITILLGNNTVAVAFTTVATIELSRYFSGTLTWLLVTVIILLFGEILPKSIFRVFANRVLKYSTPVIRLFYWMLYPLIQIIRLFTSMLFSLMNINADEARSIIAKKEYATILLDASEKLNIHDANRGLIRNMFELEKLIVRKVIIPRMEIVALDIEQPYEALVELLLKKNLSRILVYKDNLDDIEGYIYYQDMINLKDDWRTKIMPILRIPDTKRLDDLLIEMRNQKEKIAIVIDEHGGTKGLISLEDIIEQIFGEIEDEHDFEVDQIEVVEQNIFLIEAQLTIAECNDQLPIQFPVHPDYHTLAGYLLMLNGRIPKVSDEIHLNENWTIVVIKASKTTIKQVRLQPRDNKTMN
jgi:putative hemolysin